MGGDNEQDYFQMNPEDDSLFMTGNFDNVVKKINKEQGISERKEYLVTGGSQSLSKSKSKSNIRFNDQSSSANPELVIIDRSIKTVHRKEILKNIGDVEDEYGEEDGIASG